MIIICRFCVCMVKGKQGGVHTLEIRVFELGVEGLQHHYKQTWQCTCSCWW